MGGQWKLPALTNTDLVGTVAGLLLDTFAQCLN